MHSIYGNDYKYNNKGRCPRCNGVLLAAYGFFVELLFKDKHYCVECSRVWALNNTKDALVRFQ